jgi:hypothetical protein
MLFQPILFLLFYQFHFMSTKEHCRATLFPPTGKELSIFLCRSPDTWPAIVPLRQIDKWLLITTL